MLTVSDHTPASEGAPVHAHTGGRRGHPCTTKTRVVDLGDRPTCRPGPQNGPGLSGGKRQVGQRVSGGEDSFARFTDYAAARLKEDAHLWATALHDEVVALGYERSYPAFTRALRLRGLRPACEPCHPATGRPAAVIEHPAGEKALCGIPHKASAPG